ncbi:MAG TPA: LysM peptidoglycan-binding domain-containing protein [Sedimenticola sp.]|nr:LysM peptidoglycan-binding domain-containing protein [Sedimenticola sp.]
MCCPIDLTTRLLTLLLLCLSMAGWGASYPLPAPGEDVVGEIQTLTTRYEDTFSDIARAYDLGYQELVDANPGVDPWLPGAGIELTLPTRYVLPPAPRQGIVINLPELRLYYYPKGENRVITHPLGIGREGWATPTGYTRIVRKKEHPAWRPPESIRQEAAAEGNPLPDIVGPGPDNPLGDYAMYLGLPGYLLHGTNKPYGVGMRVSHGCIRLYPEDIEYLFPQVPVGTTVDIIDAPYKAGWLDGELLLEAHRPLADGDSSGRGGDFTALVSAVVERLKGQQRRPDWDALKEAVIEHLGYPVPVPLLP